MNHQELVKIISQELFENKNVLALMLYGSVSRHEEKENSDIDLLVIVNEKHCQKRHEVRNGIIVEYLEMHTEYLQNFITKNEIPVIFTLVEGIVLFDRNSIFDDFITVAKKIIDKGPAVNDRWENEKYVTKKRSDVIEIFYDLLDTNDVIIFNYLVSLLINTIIPMLNENFNLWPKTRKKTLPYLKSQCHDGYKCIEILLNPDISLSEKCIAAKNLIEYTFKKHGGIIEGNAIIFCF